MCPINKPLLRVAIAIHGQLTSPTVSQPLIELPVTAWERCVGLARQIRRAQLRDWRLAAARLQVDLNRALLSLSDQLDATREQLRSLKRTDDVVPASEIYHDLVALGQEFEELTVDLQTRRLSVVTESIVLEGVHLGAFEIQLQQARHSHEDRPAYRVIAKDPHPAESRDNVTHPHVMDEILCEGEGRHAIRQALAQGRLLDFFTLIAGVLRNYNQESPFVELAQWGGSACGDCGQLVDDDDSYSCHKCGESICGECESVCGGCDESCCSGCIGSCAACEESHCRRCLKICNGCQRRVCSDCLDQNERCTSCNEDEPDEDEGSDDDEPASTDLTVQPDSVGEALVPA